VAAAHAHGIEVWLDVVFNHTGEGEEIKPTLCLRGFDDARAYLHLPDGTYNDDSGTGNVSNPGDPNIRHLILTALERFADLGIDGFRFDLASLLTRDGGVLVEQITEWAAGRDVRLIAEPWDLGEYQLGKWAPPWLQWNDRFRDDVRGFVRGEPGKVGIAMQRVQGSPDLLSKVGGGTVNFISAHDGLTMHDLTLVTSDKHHSWNIGEALRMQQLKNYFTMLLLSSGTAMFVMGDEFARTQQGLDNPFDVDSEVSWVDWRPPRRVEGPSRLRPDVAARAACPSAYGLPLLRRDAGRPGHWVGVALAGVVCRRSVRDGQRVVAAAAVRGSRGRTVGGRAVDVACIERAVGVVHHSGAAVDDRVASAIVSGTCTG
jgi:glycogen operon protein